MWIFRSNKKKKILILIGHSNPEPTLPDFFMDFYREGAEKAGHEVKTIRLADLKFDPILHNGYRKIQKLEPDLVKVQEEIKWCDHLVIAYPSWWSTMPAILKGMFDRMWLPQFAYRFHEHGYWWDRLLKGRSAHVFVTSDSHPILARFIFGDTTNEIKRAILWFSGFSPIRITKIGPVQFFEKRKRKIERKWKNQLIRMGRKAK